MKLLIIEDDECTRNILYLVCQEFGEFDCSTVSKRDDAIDRVLEVSPEIILLDLILQHENCSYLLPKIIETNTSKCIVIPMSASHDKLKVMVATYNVELFLKKPFDLDNLKDMLDRAKSSLYIEPIKQ